MSELNLYLPHEASLADFARRLSLELAPGSVLFLKGPLGAGKTCFARSFIQARGHLGPVKSPTYNLVEIYEALTPAIYHFDLYRIEDLEELELIGIRDYFHEAAICLIEWPERGAGLLPTPDLEAELALAQTGRALTLRAKTEHGNQIVSLLK